MEDYEHHITSNSNRATADTRTKDTFNNNNVLISLSNDALTFAWILMFEYYISGCPVRFPDILVLYVQVPDVWVTDIRVLKINVENCQMLLYFTLTSKFFVVSLARFMFYVFLFLTVFVFWTVQQVLLFSDNLIFSKQ